jgi:glycolate oxidase iron-sulfur subunit
VTTQQGLDSSDELRRLAGDCVHCGFCLPACPTYQLWGEEMDSPRGRIHLITQVLDGAEGSSAAAEHLDRCLGCMACMPACPSGVRYDRLIEAARAWAEEPESAPEPAPAPGPAPIPPAGSAAEQAAARPVAEQAAGHAPAGQAAADDVPAADVSAGRPAADVSAGQAAAAGPAQGPGQRRLPPRSQRDRLTRAAIFATFPYPRRLRLAAASLRATQRTRLDRLIERSGLVGRVSPELAAALRVAPQPSANRTQSALAGGSAPRRLPTRVPARGTRRGVVGMLTGCVQRVFFPEVNAATARVLAAEGCDVVIPAEQACCGALSLHGGRRAEAVRFARSTIETFERAGVDAIIVNSAGCGSAMKEYGGLTADDPAWASRAAAVAGKVRDFSEFLAELGPVAARQPLRMTAAYHDACHLAHAQRITAQPRELLLAIPGLSLADIADGGTCCGSAGIYNLVQPEPARELGDRKAAAVAATSADLIVSGNPGCAMQIASALRARGTPMPMAHIAEVIDASIRGTGLNLPER